MEFEFWGESESFVDIDIEEFEGYTREQIAVALAEMAEEGYHTEFDEDQFLRAADSVLSELARG